MNIGLVDVDGHSGFPNLALMKIARFHRLQGDHVEWASPMTHYDKVYMSKVFTFTQDDNYFYDADEIIRGGGGYDLRIELPKEIDRLQPDYTIYPNDDGKTAYGFLTRGCPNKCSWCVVPVKEGAINPYMDVEEIAMEGRKKLILMDNNILAAGDYAVGQLHKIIEHGYRVDFNQALDARQVNKEFAELLAKVRWLKYVRFGCDTTPQIAHCQRAVDMMQEAGYRGAFMFYTIIREDLTESYNRIKYWWQKQSGKYVCQSQPYLNFNDPHQRIPQWQRDLARWSNNHYLFRAMAFEDYEPRKGFRCREYFDR